MLILSVIGLGGWIGVCWFHRRRDRWSDWLVSITAGLSVAAVPSWLGAPDWLSLLFGLPFCLAMRWVYWCDEKQLQKLQQCKTAEERAAC